MENKYVLGFVFTENRINVMLIEKNKPDWQKGKLNGIGGKIESGETPLQAMIRECKEETSLEIKEWQEFGVMSNSFFSVVCFRSFNDLAYNTPIESNEGDINIYEVDDIVRGQYATINNLQWVILFALDTDVFDGYVFNGKIIKPFEARP